MQVAGQSIVCVLEPTPDGWMRLPDDARPGVNEALTALLGVLDRRTVEAIRLEFPTDGGVNILVYTKAPITAGVFLACHTLSLYRDACVVLSGDAPVFVLSLRSLHDRGAPMPQPSSAFVTKSDARGLLDSLRQEKTRALLAVVEEAARVSSSSSSK